MRARTLGTATALALCLAAGAADAATWVRYSFSGTGTATYTANGASAARNVSFGGTAYVDLDGGVPSYLSSLPATVSAAAGPGTLDFSLAQQVMSGVSTNWSAAAALPGAARGFALLAPAQPVGGTVRFDLLAKGTSYRNGTGSISTLTVERVTGPGSWDFSVREGAAAPGPVPEPGTWVTLVGGFALLGLGARYRRGRRRASFG